MQTPQLLAMVPIGPSTHIFFQSVGAGIILNVFSLQQCAVSGTAVQRIFDGFTFNMDAFLIPRRKMMVVPRHDYFFHSRIIATIWHCMPQRLDRRRKKISLKQRCIWIYFRVNSSIVAPDFQSKMPWGNMMAKKLHCLQTNKGEMANTCAYGTICLNSHWGGVKWRILAIRRNQCSKANTVTMVSFKTQFQNSTSMVTSPIKLDHNTVQQTALCHGCGMFVSSCQGLNYASVNASHVETPNERNNSMERVFFNSSFQHE